MRNKALVSRVTSGRGKFATSSDVSWVDFPLTDQRCHRLRWKWMRADVTQVCSLFWSSITYRLTFIFLYISLKLVSFAHSFNPLRKSISSFRITCSKPARRRASQPESANQIRPAHHITGMRNLWLRHLKSRRKAKTALLNTDGEIEGAEVNFGSWGAARAPNSGWGRGKAGDLHEIRHGRRLTRILLYYLKCNPFLISCWSVAIFCWMW